METVLVDGESNAPYRRVSPQSEITSQEVQQKTEYNIILEIVQNLKG